MNLVHFLSCPTECGSYLASSPFSGGYGDGGSQSPFIKDTWTDFRFKLVVVTSLISDPNILKVNVILDYKQLLVNIFYLFNPWTDLHETFFKCVVMTSKTSDPIILKVKVI